MDKMKEKVFCIGHNKTGTTSIGKMLSDFGYNVAPQRPFEDFYIKDLALKNKPSLFDLIEKYDAFQDIPFSKSDYYLKIYENILIQNIYLPLGILKSGLHHLYVFIKN